MSLEMACTSKPAGYWNGIASYAITRMWWRIIQLSEKVEVKRDGARATKNSGRGKIQKGDAQLGDFTIDYKEAKSSFTLNVKVWGKVAKDAWTNRNSVPVLKVILGETVKERLFIINEETFQDYIRLLEKEKEDG